VGEVISFEKNFYRLPFTSPSLFTQSCSSIDHDMVAGIGPNSSQQQFCFAVYAATMLALHMQDDEILSWDEFKVCYDTLYLEGQTWLPCGVAGVPTTGTSDAPGPLGNIRRKLSGNR
jgi:hypothetical protein